MQRAWRGPEAHMPADDLQKHKNHESQQNVSLSFVDFMFLPVSAAMRNLRAPILAAYFN